MSNLAFAVKLLEENGFPFDDLPNDRNDNLWTNISETYALSLPQLSALKNARCAPISTGI